MRMNAVKINKVELLEILRKNKETHTAEFNEAVEDYIAAAIKIAKENMTLAKSGDLDKIARFRSLPQKPISYESSYTRAIRMLELSVDTVIEVEEQVFNQLVLDEWHWKASFTTSNAIYKSY